MSEHIKGKEVCLKMTRRTLSASGHWAWACSVRSPWLARGSQVLGMAMITFSIAGISLISTPCAGSTCETIMDGVFTDPAVWDCGCDPLNCDSLIIDKALTAEGLLVLTNDLVHVLPGGSLISDFQVSMFARLLNEGVVDVYRLYQTQNAPTLRNEGMITANELMLWGDSAVNEGTIHAPSSLNAKPWTRILNSGLMDGGYLGAYVLYNYDTLAFNAAALNYSQINEGYAVFHDQLIEQGSWFNESGGILESESIIVQNNLSNSGLVVVHGLLQFGNDTAYGSLDGFPPTARIECGNLKIHGHIQGYGDICVLDSSINFANGLIDGSVDICDASLSTITAPFIDVNLGTVGTSVGWCDQTGCVTGIDAVVLAEPLTAYPVPANDAVFLRLSNPADLARVLLTNAQGQTVHLGYKMVDNGIWIERGSLSTGLYYARLFSADEKELMVVGLLFLER